MSGCCDVVQWVCGVLCLICDACSWRCSMCVLRVGCVFVYVVHPVAILSVVFCVICSLCLMLLVTIWWKRTRVWVLSWLYMLR